MLRAVVLSLVVALLFGLAGGPARADDFSDALAGFAANKYSKTADALSRIAASGNDRAAAVIQALKDGRLYVAGDRKIYIKDTSGAVLDAATGVPFTGEGPFGLKKIRVNNLVRGAIGAAMGMVRLSAADPARRVAAAEAVFQSRDKSALPAVDAALAKETDADVKRVLEQARAAIVVGDTTAPEAERIAAVQVLADRGDQDALGLLSAVPADAAPALRNAADGASSHIQSQLAVWNTVQNVWYGLSLGSVLLLAAIGLAITFGVMGVINMAHGELVMLGAYTTFVVQEVIRAHAPGLFDYSLFIAIPAAFLVSGAVGVVIERGVIRFLYGRPLETLLATWGISLVLQQMVRTIFGPTNRDVGNPSWMAGAFDLGQLSITNNRLWIIIFSIIVFGLLMVVIRRTSFGLRMRAVTQNRPMAASMGIRTGRIDALTFGLGSGIAGMAGVALSQIDNVSPNLGQGYIIDSFLVVVFGGVGNLWGTLVGAVSLGVVNKFLEPFAGAVLGKILVLVGVILFIQKRPRGLFALKGRAVES